MWPAEVQEVVVGQIPLAVCKIRSKMGGFLQVNVKVKLSFWIIGKLTVSYQDLCGRRPVYHQPEPPKHGLSHVYVEKQYKISLALSDCSSRLDKSAIKVELKSKLLFFLHLATYIGIPLKYEINNIPKVVILPSWICKVTFHLHYVQDGILQLDSMKTLPPSSDWWVHV